MNGKIERYGGSRKEDGARPTPIEMELVLFERAGMRKTSAESIKPIFMGHITGEQTI